MSADLVTLDTDMAKSRSRNVTKSRAKSAPGSATSARGSSKPGVPRSRFSEAGKTAAYDAQRKLLLDTLNHFDWSLTDTALELGLVNASNVIRAINTLDLLDEYEAAKASGKIPKGPRS